MKLGIQSVSHTPFSSELSDQLSGVGCLHFSSQKTGLDPLELKLEAVMGQHVVLETESR